MKYDNENYILMCLIQKIFKTLDGLELKFSLDFERNSGIVCLIIYGRVKVILFAPFFCCGTDDTLKI